MAGDPYQELGVARTASQAEIRKAFHKLAKQLHPDQNPNDKAAEERFKRVSSAFDLLGDAEKRAKFDRGEIDADGREQFRGFGGGGFGGGGRPGGQQGGFGGQFEGADLNDIFSMFGGGGRPRGPQKGQDVRARLEISLEDAISGATRRIAFSDGRTLDVTIPKGAADGQTLRLKGQGAPGRGGAAGDALIELVIAPHPTYRREGADLHMDVAVTVPDAVLGGKIAVRTPDGTVNMNLPKGSNSGKVLRLKGRGGFDARSGKRGDLMARLMVTLPGEPDPKLEAFAEEWRAKRPYSVDRK